MKRQFQSVIGLIFASLLMVLATPIFAQDATPEAVIIGTAYINDIFILEVDGLSVAVTGELNDSCTTVGNITQTVQDQKISIVIETTRPADAFCAMVLETFNITIPLEIADLPAGDYTLDVNGTTVGFTLGASAAGVDAQTAPETTVDSPCPVATGELSAFASDDGFYCFLYPAGYDVQVLDALNMVVSTPSTLASGASLMITMEPRLERSLSDIAQERQSGITDITLNFESVTIGGADALITEDIPAPVKTRYAFIELSTIFLTIQLQPIDTFNPEATELANTLWTTVTDNMVFPMEVPAMVCPEAGADTALFIGDGFCFLHPQDAFIVNNDTMAFLILGDITLIVERIPNVESLAQFARDLQADYSDPIGLNPIIINGLAGLVTESMPEQSDTRQAFTVYEGNLVYLIMQPFADPIAESLWQTVTDSLVIGR